ncbi:F-box domain protein [Nemania abortiva]|nr:F-box domain protein [Nemania abortiva]
MFHTKEFDKEEFGPLELITLIAKEPRVARYIEQATLRYPAFARDPNLPQDPNLPRDHNLPRDPNLPRDLPDADDEGPLTALFARSPYLTKAGLDWKAFYAQIKKDYALVTHYMQNAVAFLMTLLPNVRRLTLQLDWNPQEDAKKLLEVIVSEAKKPNSVLDERSLAQVTTFHHMFSRPNDNLNEVGLFLDLPNVSQFMGQDCVSIFSMSVPNEPYFRYGEALETVHLRHAYFDEAAIRALLRCTPRLKVLWYHHSQGGLDRRGERYSRKFLGDWDCRQFVMAIEAEVGHHLEELSLSTSAALWRAFVHPGGASTRGFKRLQKLTLPLQFTFGNIQRAKLQDVVANDSLGACENEPLVCDLVPSSVSELTLQSRAMDDDEKALKALFHNLAAIKKSKLPSLKRIFINHDGPSWFCKEDGYRAEYWRLCRAAEEVGVLMKMTHTDIPVEEGSWYPPVDSTTVYGFL